MWEAATPARRSDPDDHRWDGSDAALAAQLAAGEVAPFARLQEKYWQPLVGYAMRMLRHQDAAEDVVQETFVRLWENRASLDPGQSLKGYLFRTARNLVIDEIRRAQVRENRAPRMAQSPPPTPAEVTEVGELERAVERAIDTLAERRREVFMLAHFDNLTYRQISEVLGIAPQTVANHMTLALRELRTALQPYVDRRLGPR